MRIVPASISSICLLRVSLGENTRHHCPKSRAGVLTHLSMQAPAGGAPFPRRYAGRDIIGECGYLLQTSGPYAGSSEELTGRCRSTWPSAVPLAMTAMLLAGVTGVREQTGRAVGMARHFAGYSAVSGTIESADFSLMR